VEAKRIDPAAFQAALEVAAQHVTAAFAVLRPFLVVISEEERIRTPRVRHGFLAAARDLAYALVDYPAIGAAVDYDAQAVADCLDNASRLSQVTVKLGELSQRIADSHLVWVADAWQPSLAAYGVAKIAARKNAALRTVVSALGKLFTAPPKPEEEEGALEAGER
jgi:hypothetical protein